MYILYNPHVAYETVNMMDFTLVIRLCYTAKVKEFCKWSEGSTLVDFELCKKRDYPGWVGPNLWVVLNAGAHDMNMAQFHTKCFRNKVLHNMNQFNFMVPVKEILPAQ